MEHTILKTEALKAYYVLDLYGKAKVVKAVNEVDLDIKENEIYGIAGESGCGKSTLLKTLVAAVEPPLRVVGGRVTYRVAGVDVDVATLSDEEKRQAAAGVYRLCAARLHERAQPSDQDQGHLPRFHREPHQCPAEGRGLRTGTGSSSGTGAAGYHSGRLSAPAFRRHAPTRDHCPGHPAQAAPHRRRRTNDRARCRCAAGCRATAQRYQSDLRNTVVLVTHDMGVHANVADRIGIMYAGKIVEEGTTERIFADPQHPYTKYLIESLPKFGDKTPRDSVPGSPPSLADLPSGCPFHPRCPHVKAICKSEMPPSLRQADGHRVACWLVEDGVVVSQRPAAQMSGEGTHANVA